MESGRAWTNTEEGRKDDPPAPGFTSPVSAAQNLPTIAVTAHVSTSYLPGSYGTVALHRLTLHITGSNFSPGSIVRIALMSASPWKVLAKGSTHAEEAVITTVCPSGHELCSRPNPQAGTIDYRMRLSSVPAASTLLMLYRSARLTGMRDVTL